MPLINALPTPQGARWSSAAPQQALDLITTWNLDEKDALNAPPSATLGWAEIGSHTGQGVGVVKFGHAMPSSLNFSPFKPGGTRDYKTIDAVVAKAQPAPADLSFVIPMIYDEAGNGWKLMSPTGEKDLRGQDILMEFLGIDGIGADYVVAGKAYKCQLIASLFYNSMYCTNSGLTLTAPVRLTYPQGKATGGIALFSDGTGAAGSVGDSHYANPTVASSGQFKNVYSAFGAFDAPGAYGKSLRLMTTKPHPTLANKTSGATVTDTFGPTHMREKFWQMAVASLTLQTATVGGNGVAAAPENVYSQFKSNLELAKKLGMDEDNFLGAGFGPRRFWILSELDNHPYVLANPNTNGTGQPADMWVNVSAGTDRATGRKRPSWVKCASNSLLFVPTFHFYGPGDPRAQGERMMRFEGDLDADAVPGAPGEIDVFFQV